MIETLKETESLTVGPTEIVETTDAITLIEIQGHIEIQMLEGINTVEWDLHLAHTVGLTTCEAAPQEINANALLH